MLARFMLMLTLVFAGEIVFLLPFHTTRFFRPTMLEAFGLTNTQLGDFFAAYGVMAMIAYFPGGALADRERRQAGEDRALGGVPRPAVAQPVRAAADRERERC